MSAAIGYRRRGAYVRRCQAMEKDLLRSKGVIVKEYEGDYGEAVAEGRALSDKEETSYFVDDEHSSRLFLGYAAAALHLRKQLEEKGIPVDCDHPLFVYLPCGVGGAPGGINAGPEICIQGCRSLLLCGTGTVPMHASRHGGRRG